MARPRYSLFPILLLLSACGSMPEVKISYYLPQSEAVITVVQSTACLKSADISGNESWQFYTYSNISYRTEYSADTKNDESFKTVDLSKVDAWHGKSDLQLKFTKDGRLASINGSNEGRVGSYIRSIAAAFAATANMPLMQFDEHPCDVLARHSRAKTGKDEAPTVLTVTLVGRGDFRGSKEIEFEPIDVSTDFYEAIKPMLGEVIASYEIGEVKKKMIDFDKEKYRGQTIAFRNPKLVTVTTIVNDGANEITAKEVAKISAPHLGDIYYLPIQKPPFFGTNSVQINAQDDGSLSLVKYASDASDAALPSALQEAYKSLKEDELSTKEQAEEIKAQADLIKQTERLAKCQIDDLPCE